MILFLRSFSFYVGLVTGVFIFSPLSLLILPLPLRYRYYILTRFSYLMVGWLKYTCGVTYQVKGTENLPSGAAVVLSKHQSAWETLAFAQIFPFQVWILKRELLRIPLFGWALATLQPIAIDRKSIHKSIRKITEQGQQHLQKGRWIIIYPEGTRVAPGEKRRYTLTGALLAVRSGCPVVPVALNSGTFWPRQSFIKHPGVIQVSIGPLIESTDRSPQEINALAETWIENEMKQLESFYN